jgi:hypothetical protein
VCPFSMLRSTIFTKQEVPAAPQEHHKSQHYIGLSLDHFEIVPTKSRTWAVAATMPRPNH